MKTILHLGSLGLILTVACIGRAAENPVEGRETKVEGLPLISEPFVAKTKMHEQMARLVREDAGIFTAPSPAEAANEVVDVSLEKMLELEPMTVKGRKFAIPPPRHENLAQEFFRTGTVWEKVGPRFSRRLTLKGDEGVLFRLSW